ncbi:MAG: hypothetical protein EA379_12000 [Phycisphaerales bacterium]|nr:MAG: hypothetical protein EA379_12000 [Phycisphaerales bacterium]
MAKPSLNELVSYLQELADRRNEHQAAIDEIDAVLSQFGVQAGAATGRRGPGRPKGSKKKVGRKKTSKKTVKKAGRKKTGRRGKRVQGVKQALIDALSDKPQSPGELQDKVSRKVGADVQIATQLQMLKNEGKANNVDRGQWVAA